MIEDGKFLATPAAAGTVHHVRGFVTFEQMVE